MTKKLFKFLSFCFQTETWMKTILKKTVDPIDDSAKGGLTQFQELLTMILCASKDYKRK